MPTDYDVKRRIGFVQTDGSGNIRAYTQNSADTDLFLYATPIADVAITNLGASSQSLTLTVPPSTIALFRASLEPEDATGSTHQLVLIRPLTETDSAPSMTSGLVSLFSGIAFESAVVASDSVGAAGHFEMPVNSSSQIGARSNTTNVDLNIMTSGWRDQRGRLN